MLENIPADEPQRIQNIVASTIKQLQRRFPHQQQVLRGVHAKSHGCVTATFEISKGIDTQLQHGVFAQPGREYSALVRFSNASTLVAPDSTAGADGAPSAHGSRGMAVKLMGVEGVMLGPVHGAPTQDFLMINQPVFAFANVEDYEGLSRILINTDDPRAVGEFIKSQIPSQPRFLTTAGIIGRIRSAAFIDGKSPAEAFQRPPASPVDNDYFSASPFLLGPDQVMRFRVRAIDPSPSVPQALDPNYLRTALINRLRDQSKGPVVFHFEITTLAADKINPDLHIEDASRQWADPDWKHVATLTIPLQEFDSPEWNEECERRVFTPWHGLEAHRPLGGLNRMRRAVYEASAMFRNLPKEPGV